ncbi:MAG TPA: PorV/PorQ family protein [Candidatus Krumholzibacteria bacterium]|nr:PorV/PorQ family protein [Candidatus Krumholzibacteria bacterium]
MRNLAALVLVGILGAAAAHAADDGGTQSPFLLGAGAREQAMGRTGAATAVHAEALYWNPARLAYTERPDLTLFRTELFVDGSTYHTSFASYPTLDLGTLAIGYQRLDVSDIERVDERNRVLGSFDNAESSLLVGYGRNVGPLVALGASLRVVQQAVDDASDASVGLDLGIALQREFGSPALHRLSLGATLQNAVEPRLRLAEDDVHDPRSLKLGLGYGGAKGPIAWVLATDLDLPSAADLRPGVGLEVSYHGMLSLRGGLDDNRPTFGLGVSYRNIRFDYALRNDETLPRNDRFSIGVQFGSSLGERREQRRQVEQQRVTAELEQLLAAREHETIEATRSQAEAAFTAKKYDDALRLYRRLLALDPEDAPARAREEAAQRQILKSEAAAALASGNAVQAAATYQSIVERWPQDAEAAAGLQSARTRLQLAADLDRNLRALFVEAFGRFSKGELPAAEAALHELLRLDPRHDLGKELLARVRDAKAAARSARAPEQPRAAVVQAPAEDAAPTVHRTLSADQRRELERLHQEGLEAFAKRDFDRAIRDWRAVWLEAPDFESVAENLIKAYLWEGVELYGRGEYDAALERCRRVLEIDPHNEKAKRYVERIQEEKAEVEQRRHHEP